MELYKQQSSFHACGNGYDSNVAPWLDLHPFKESGELSTSPKEVRDTFSCFNEMTTTKLSQLVFLSACMEEALRMYPPHVLQKKQETRL
jgi:hypothetical protein